MKHILSLLLAAALALGLTACGKPASSAEEIIPDGPFLPVTEPAPIPETPPAPPEPTAEELAAQRVDDLLLSLTPEEKVGQLFFVRCPADNAVEDISAYHLGGYVLFGRDFKTADGSWLTRQQVENAITAYQSAAAADTGIPLLIGVDEEGGTVVRVSSNPNLREKKFPSPQKVFSSGGMDAVRADAAEKSQLLKELGINVNLAPVADVSTDPNDFIYSRTFGQDALATEAYVTAVISAMRDNGMGSVLKHFPGYGSNVDTHTGIAIDTRPLDAFYSGDLLPFRAHSAGSGTTAVLVSHNIVACMDAELPASLSPEIHRLLREKLDFDGVAMTDDLAMDAVESYAGDGAVAVMALQAGSDLLITTDYRTQIPRVLEAVKNGTLSMETIDTACRRVLVWKQNLGLIP